MLKAVISHNEQAAIVELPMDRLSLQYELSQIGIRRLAKDIPIMDEEDQPISVKLYSEVDNGYALDNERAIRELLQKEQNEDLNDMADYFDGSESAKAKIVSAVWDVQEVNGELFGVICTGLREVLSPAEEQEWIDELIGQAADGFGEGLEQRPIRTADGEIYVSFWNSGSDYFMENETAFHQRMSAGPELETMKLE